MIEFNNIQFLYFLLLIPIALYFFKNSKSDLNIIFKKDILEKIKLSKSGLSKKTRAILLAMSFLFMVISFARPYINAKDIEVKSSFVNMVVALDMSKSMFANDIYPNRFSFAKKKFIDMLSYLKNTKVSLIGFSSQTFLISPLTQDFYSLKYLTNNLDINSVSLDGTDILNTLKTANELMQKQEKKILFLITDGSDQKDFKDELEYAKQNNITIYVYNIGTKKGGVIEVNGKAMTDNKGNIVVVRLNENIKKLALNSGGAYMKQTLKKDDIKLLADDIFNTFKAKNIQNSTIKDTKELFIYPLILAFLLFFAAIFSLPRKKGIK